MGFRLCLVFRSKQCCLCTPLPFFQSTLDSSRQGDGGNLREGRLRRDCLDGPANILTADCLSQSCSSQVSIGFIGKGGRDFVIPKTLTRPLVVGGRLEW